MTENPNPLLPATPAQQSSLVSMDTNTVQGFEAVQRFAKLLSTSPLVPKEYQGANGLASCVIALNLAGRLKADPLMVMQNLYVVHGRPGWSAKFLIASFNMCGRFTAIRYEFEGTPGTDEFGCRAWAIEKATGEKLVGPLVTIGLAKKEGWYGKQGSKWQSMSEQMLRYRSAGWFVNTIAPELSMGLPAADEVEDFTDAEVLNQQGSSTVSSAVTQPGAAWPIPSLERFDLLLDEAYAAFKDAGMVEHWPVFEGKWRPRRGKGDDMGVLRDLADEVNKLIPIDTTPE